MLRFILSFSVLDMRIMIVHSRILLAGPVNVCILKIHSL